MARIFLMSVAMLLTLACKEKETIPSLTTIPVEAISSEGAQSGGDIIEDGGFPVLERGVCWSTTPDPTKNSSNRTSDGEGSGRYSSLITGLSPGVSYFVRAYATNALGTAYGDEISFSASPLLPTISSTLEVTSLTVGGTAISGGEVVSDGGGQITARGICWSTTDSNPTTSLNTKTIEGGGTGKFISTLTNLSFGKYYYVRAYATNSAGTAYGNTVAFRMGGPPVVGELALKELTKFDALFRFSLSYYDQIDEYGVCWSTNPNPVIEQSPRTMGWARPLIAFSPFTASLYFVNERCGALVPGATYYVRGYAKNKWGISYTPQASFETRVIEGELFYHYGFYAGGILGYQDKINNSTLIVASGRFEGDDTYYGYEVSQLSWGCKGQTLDAIGDGIRNTELIFSNCSDPGTAANYCESFELNSYNDWFLPSIDELARIRISMNERGFISETDTEAWRYLDRAFLSSTEATPDSAWALDFINGIKYKVSKEAKVSILPVRLIRH